MLKTNNIIQWGGAGEAVVFLHYFGGSANSWQWVAEKLSDRYRCIGINLPGFGNAPAMEEPTIQGFANYVKQELTNIGVESCTLIGHSMGGKIAMQVAANDSDGLVQQLILVAPSPPTTEPMPAKEKKRMLRHPDPEEAKNTVNGATKQHLTDEKYNLAVETQLIVDQATWRWWLLEGMEHSIAERIKALVVPITVLSSQDDPVMTPEVIDQRVMQVLDQAELVTTQHIGHLIPLEAPDWLATQISNILETKK